METRKLPNDRHDSLVELVVHVVKLDEGDFGGGTSILPEDGDFDDDCKNSFKLLVVLVGVWGSLWRMLLLLSTADDWKDLSSFEFVLVLDRDFVLLEEPELDFFEEDD